MTQVPAIIVGLGALLFLVALLGGGITLKELSLPTASRGLRIVLLPISLLMMGFGVWLSLGTPLPALPTAQPPSPSGNTAAAIPTRPPTVPPTQAETAPPGYRSGPLIYEEDFEDGFAVGWDMQWSSQMVIIELDDGNHVLLMIDSQPILTLPEGTNDYAIEARVKRHAGSGGAAGLDVRWMGGSPGHQPKYSAYIDFSGGWLNLVEIDAAGEEVAAPAGLSVHGQVPFAQDTWYLLAVEARGPLVSLYLDGQLVGSDEDDTLQQSNRVGLSAYHGGVSGHEFYFDDIRVWSLE